MQKTRGEVCCMHCAKLSLKRSFEADELLFYSDRKQLSIRDGAVIIFNEHHNEFHTAQMLLLLTNVSDYAPSKTLRKYCEERLSVFLERCS